MRYSVVVDGLGVWYCYGPFDSWAAASKWACDKLNTIDDQFWHIAQFIEVK